MFSVIDGSASAIVCVKNGKTKQIILSGKKIDNSILKTSEFGTLFVLIEASFPLTSNGDPIPTNGSFRDLLAIQSEMLRRFVSYMDTN